MNKKISIEELKTHTSSLPDDYVVLRKLRSAHGLCYNSGKHRIHLDYRRELLNNFIHELIHDYDFGLSETGVRMITSRVINKLTLEDMLFFLDQLVRLVKK